MHVRRAGEDDLSILRGLRLAALQAAPEAFGSMYEREVDRPADDWRSWIEHGVTFLLVDGSGDAHGLVATRTDPDSPATAHLLAMWVDPLVRGTGGADLLVEAVVEWATVAGADVVELCVMDGNEPARRLYERHGFAPTGATCVRERDGGTEVTMQRRRSGGRA